MSPSTDPQAASAPVRRRRRLPTSAVVLSALLVLGSAYAAFAPQSSAVDADADVASEAAAIGDVESGRALFLRGCSSCHGLNAQGGSDAPSLIGIGEAAVVFQVGTGRMPLANPGPQAPRKKVKYSEEEIDDLAAYIHSLGGGPRIPEGDLTDGDLSEGGELFRLNCASCHNFAGAGGALTYGKYAPRLDESTPEEIYAAMLHGPESMPVFPDSQLTPEEKRAITNYITYLTDEYKDPGGAAIGRSGPVPEGLVAWLVGIVGMVALTVWIGARA